MSHHAPALALSVERGSFPNQPFFYWLRNHTALFATQSAALFTVISLVAGSFYYVKHAEVAPELLQPENIRKIVIYFHLLLIVIFIVVLIHMLANNSQGRYRARLVYERLGGKQLDFDKLAELCTRDVARFKRRFLGFWCSMLLLYVGFAVTSIPLGVVPHEGAARVLEPFLTFALNNLSLFFVFSCFTILHLPPDKTLSIVARAGQQEGQDDSSVNTKSLEEEYAKTVRRQRNLRRWFGALVGLPTILFLAIAYWRGAGFTDSEWMQYPYAFYALSGALNAVVLALLIARLDSKLIGLPSWLICVLYFYAGVQTLFVVFEIQRPEYQAIATAVLVVVFIFKIYFFLIIAYTLQVGRLYNYFFCSYALNDHVNEIKQQHTETKSTATPPAAAAPPPITQAEPSANDEPLSSAVDAKPDQRWRLDRPLLISFSRGIGAAAILLFMGLLLYSVATFNRYDQVFTAAPVLQRYITYLHLPLLLLICVVVGSLPVSLQTPNLGTDSWASDIPKEQSETQLSSFKKYFLGFWIMMSLLYVVFSVNQWIDSGKLTSAATMMQQMTPANANASPLPITFTGQFQFTIGQIGKAANDEHSPSEKQAVGHGMPNQSKTNADPASNSDQKLSIEPYLEVTQVAKSVRYSLICFLLNNLIVFCVFSCFRILYVPGDDLKFKVKDRALLYYSMLTTALLTLLVPLLVVLLKGSAFTQSDVAVIPKIFGAVGGTLTAVAFALLIARLDSRLIGVRSELIAILYGYAALQPLFVVFDDAVPLLRAIETCALIAAFLLKICLWLIVLHAITSGGLSRHLADFPFLNRKVNAVFDNQFEIRAYSTGPTLFKFSIFNKNVQQYEGERTFNSRDECDDEVRELRVLMADKNRYDDPPPRLGGTYWICIRNSSKRLVCQSIGLRSTEEVDTLIKESIERIPCCKYRRG